jgi:flagellar basal-body rod protein FlgF
MGDNGVIRIVGGPVTVSADGTISVQGAVAGKMKLVEFLPGTALESLGKTYYGAPKNTGTPTRQSTIAQGSLESSNVNPVASAVALVAVQRYAEMMQRALSMFHTEFNRIATEDIPRVTP